MVWYRKWLNFLKLSTNLFPDNTLILMNKNLSILFVGLLFTAQILPAQDQFRFRLDVQERDDAGLSYNFFTGQDASDFRTTILGFGSGFLLDAFTGRYATQLVTLGTERVYLGAGIGFSISKYRFVDNLILSLSPDKTMVTWQADPDPAHDYSNSFFGYGKSKLVTTSLFFPVDLNIALGDNWVISAGGFADLYLFGKHKRKYMVENSKIKELVGPKEFRNYNLNKTKLGLEASIWYKKLGLGLCGTWFVTPFFKKEMGPALHEGRVSLNFNIRDGAVEKRDKKERKKEKEDMKITI